MSKPPCKKRMQRYAKVFHLQGLLYCLSVGIANQPLALLANHYEIQQVPLVNFLQKKEGAKIQLSSLPFLFGFPILI
jgi:hypothetical protein